MEICAYLLQLSVYSRDYQKFLQYFFRSLEVDRIKCAWLLILGGGKMGGFLIL